MRSAPLLAITAATPPAAGGSTSTTVAAMGGGAAIAGLKPGVYDYYYCTPHLALGRKATMTVQ